jgi:hypothetical protein
MITLKKKRQNCKTCHRRSKSDARIDINTNKWPKLLQKEKERRQEREWRPKMFSQQSSIGRLMSLLELLMQPPWYRTKSL